MNLEHNGVIIEGDENLLAHATKYYSELFGPAPEFNIQINDDIWDGSVKLSESDNEQLCKSFFESEIKNA